MLKSLRRRLILSHVLPVLVILPFMGIALLYVLETQLLLPSISDQLRAQALLVARLAAQQPQVWDDSARAQQFLAGVDHDVEARVELIGRDGRLLASTDPSDAGLLGQPSQAPSLPAALAGQIEVRTAYSRSLQSDVADVTVPVLSSENQVLGVVRLTHSQSTVYGWFLRLRYIIVAVMAGGTLVAAAIGWALALNTARPLARVTGAIRTMAEGREATPVPEQGPEEISLLAGSFNLMLERLRALEQARNQLLANLVHELSRPLGALLSATQALQRGADEDPELRRELLTGIEGEILRLQRLVDDLAHLHDRALGPLELVPRPVALTGWLNHALVPWREAAQAKGLRWEASIPPDLPTAEMDADRIAQALGNLLSNAVKYTPAGGEISVAAEAEDEFAWISVTDTGSGIDQKDQERIFQPFHRGSWGHRFPQGMGLGLTIARDLVAAHGGKIEVESAPGAGSRFVLRLPLRPR